MGRLSSARLRSCLRILQAALPDLNGEHRTNFTRSRRCSESGAAGVREALLIAQQRLPKAHRTPPAPPRPLLNRDSRHLQRCRGSVPCSSAMARPIATWDPRLPWQDRGVGVRASLMQLPQRLATLPISHALAPNGRARITQVSRRGVVACWVRRLAQRALSALSDTHRATALSPFLSALSDTHRATAPSPLSPR